MSCAGGPTMLAPTHEVTDPNCDLVTLEKNYQIAMAKGDVLVAGENLLKKLWVILSSSEYKQALLVSDVSTLCDCARNTKNEIAKEWSKALPRSHGEDSGKFDVELPLSWANINNEYAESGKENPLLNGGEKTSAGKESSVRTQNKKRISFLHAVTDWCCSVMRRSDTKQSDVPIVAAALLGELLSAQYVKESTAKAEAREQFRTAKQFLAGKTRSRYQVNNPLNWLNWYFLKVYEMEIIAILANSDTREADRRNDFVGVRHLAVTVLSKTMTALDKLRGVVELAEPTARVITQLQHVLMWVEREMGSPSRQAMLKLAERRKSEGAYAETADCIVRIMTARSTRRATDPEMKQFDLTAKELIFLYSSTLIVQEEYETAFFEKPLAERMGRLLHEWIMFDDTIETISGYEYHTDVLALIKSCISRWCVINGEFCKGSLSLHTRVVLRCLAILLDPLVRYWKMSGHSVDRADLEDFTKDFLQEKEQHVKTELEFALQNFAADHWVVLVVYDAWADIVARWCGILNHAAAIARRAIKNAEDVTLTSPRDSNSDRKPKIRHDEIFERRLAKAMLKRLQKYVDGSKAPGSSQQGLTCS